jgi:hypothetical protein
LCTVYNLKDTTQECSLCFPSSPFQTTPGQRGVGTGRRLPPSDARHDTASGLSRSLLLICLSSSVHVRQHRSGTSEASYGRQLHLLTGLSNLTGKPALAVRMHRAPKLFLSGHSCRSPRPHSKQKNIDL